MKIIKKSIFIGALALALGTSAQAMDTVLYTKMVNDTVHEVRGGFVPNVKRYIKMQKQLVQLGVAGSKEYIMQHPEHADILGLVVDNADNMMKMTLDEIEDQWHQGKFLKSHGHDVTQMDHFGELFSLMDSIIHPATAYIALKEYKRTSNTAYLDRTAAELIEVVEHIAQIGKKGQGTKLTSNH